MTKLGDGGDDNDDDDNSTFDLLLYLLPLCVSLTLTVAVFLCKFWWPLKSEHGSLLTAPDAKQQTPTSLTAYDLVAATFALTWQRQLTCTSEGARSPSVVVSSVAIQMAMGACLAGAKGQTSLSIRKALFPGCLSSTDCSETLRTLAAACTNVRTAKKPLRLLIRIYTSGKLDTTADCFRSTNKLFNEQLIHAVDFRIKSLNQLIADDWPDYAQSSDVSENDDEKLTVISFCSFVDRFRTPFDAVRTRQLPFFYRRNRSKPCEMMQQINSFGFYQNERCQTLRIDYETANVSLYICLPKLRCSLNDYEKTVTPQFLLTLFKACSVQVIDVCVPKFKLKSELDSKTTFNNLQLKQMTEGTADFSGFGGKFRIGRILHKVQFEVTDESDDTTSQLKSVSVGLGSRSSSMGSGKTFTADHPFLYYVVTQSPYVVQLISGRYCGPTK